MDNKIVCVIIPVYKSHPSYSELASFSQCLKILGGYSIYIICPDELDVTRYQNTTSRYRININFVFFSAKYFSSIRGYNALLLSKKFNTRFKAYEYMLIYQLDAWVFKDELTYWCNQDYDYIGAPWFNKGQNGKLVFTGIGNGGFSLRKIESHLRVLHSFSYLKKPGYLFYLLKKNRSIKTLIGTIMAFTFRNNTHHLLNDYQGNEDYFWGIIATRNFNWFKVPKESIAIGFSVEMYPSILITEKDKLPFGCHAWEQYEPDFWKKHIKPQV